MIESVIPMDSPLFDQSHCPEVFLFPGLIRQPGISPCDLNACVAKKRLQTLKPHSGIQELACKSVAQTMQSVPIVKKSGFFQVFYEHGPRTGVGQTLMGCSVKKYVLPWILLFKPCDQSFLCIGTEVDNPSHSCLSRLIDEYFLLFEVDVLHPESEKLPYPHSRSQEHEYHGSVSDASDTVNYC